MGIVLTALIWFVFGAIIGMIFIVFGVSLIVYGAAKYNDTKAHEALNKFYSVGKRFYKK